MTEQTLPRTPEEPAAPAAAAGPFAAPAEPPRKPLRERRVLRAVARWSLAVVVAGGLGVGTAAFVTSQERTDLPGLATASDGRWDFPRQKLPALPADAPRPDHADNAAGIHHADLRDLLVTAPGAAEPDAKLTGDWTPASAYLAEYAKGDRRELGNKLHEFALRHAASRAWTMPDGTEARVHLLRFPSSGLTDLYRDEGLDFGSTTGASLAHAEETSIDKQWTSRGVPDTTSVYAYEEPAPYGDDQVQTRVAYIVAGDTLGMVVHEKKGGADRVPFHQTVVLQTQLLS
ncbi:MULTISPECIES: hypothetical protein [Streptomyces]|jgi:hypothetical protein|uniref:Uncharacterized protein n=1 Tax=Streptomyces albidoflavus TaxID=1886 RepID=A0A8G2E035_9ACTN|nr:MULTISPECIES: hypothetical protein [Streptomyces]MBK3383963.1 hypothetical protein [Streptomyces sp. DEF147AK]MBK3389448.1 hypothetical protein [Streptomyces sp. DEF1AK]RZE22074.1 hypothetical protein C0Q92_17645 [Streptomyces albidoflavus]RZE25984.1 hypothetical protein C0Q96_17360 [Streptomyces albidoflavus]RZE42908.1 hypothetical protein C0Q95_16725 [Streptomyces albidoflavus]